MNDAGGGLPMTQRLAETLYVEALLLADETRTYFDQEGRSARDGLPPAVRVTFACEALKATTRIMGVIGRLAALRNAQAGSTQEDMFGAASGPSDPDALRQLPDEAVRLIQAGMELAARVDRIGSGMGPADGDSPARALLQRIERSL